MRKKLINFRLSVVKKILKMFKANLLNIKRQNKNLIVKILVCRPPQRSKNYNFF